MVEMRFKDKVMIATGCASGIGKATAKLFGSEGAKLILVDINEKELNVVVNELQKNDVQVFAYIGDVSESETAQETVAMARNKFGRLDILFNNAAFNPVGNLVDTPEDVWDRTMNVNVKSAYLFIKYGIPLMEENGGGVIINTASIAAYRASNNESAYSISKAAILHMTNNVARNFGRRGIRCNAICPGYVPSLMFNRRECMTQEEIDARNAKGAELCPMGCIGSYEDMANAVAFLASDDAAFISASAIKIDGALVC